MTQQVILQMKKQNSGHVVNISAVLPDQPSGSALPLLAVISKSPMPAVSKALALGYAVNNIRFNTVSPGVINTPMHANDNHAAQAKFHPLARMGEVSDIVDAILYLQNATFVTGENIRVDGGVHAGRREAVERLHLPFRMLSDAGLAFASALNLPTFEVGGETLLKRFTLVVDSGRISKVFYPVFPPNKSGTGLGRTLTKDCCQQCHPGSI